MTKKIKPPSSSTKAAVSANGKAIPPRTNSNKRPDVDWARVERMYRAGLLSVKEIGRQCNVSDVSILKRAKKERWSRDLQNKVIHEAREKLVRAAVREEARALPETEEQIVEEASNIAAGVVTHHRKDINRARLIVHTLFEQLGFVVENRNELEQVIDAEIKGDVAKAATGDGVVTSTDLQRLRAKRRKMMESISLPANAAIARDLAMSMRHLVGLERQAFGLSDGDDGNKRPDDVPLVAYDVRFS